MRSYTSKICSAVVILLSLPSLAHAVVVGLSPLQAGVYTGGDGVLSRWVQVTDAWNGQYGVEQLADAAAVMALPVGDPNILRTLDTKVSTINFSDDVYRSQWEPSWTPVGGTVPVPLFSANDSYQDDYVAFFAGFISITDPGEYNFGILFDDGFRFTLTGLNGAYTIFRDGLNPRELVGFDSNFVLEAGIYQFSLTSYEHLEASVTALNWWYGPAASNFGIIPQAHLFSEMPPPIPPPAPIPEPGELLLFMVGLLALAWNFRKNPIVASDFSSRA